MSAVTAVRSRKGGKARNVPEWSFGDRLRKARLVANLQQEDIAVAFRVSKVSVSKWELGKTQPQDVFATAEQYEKLTGVDKTWLLTGEDLTLTYTSPFRSPPDGGESIELKAAA